MGKTIRKTKWATTESADRRFLEVGEKTCVGPGGWDCACCAPPRGKRDIYFRRLRRLEKEKVRNMDREVA